MTGTYLLTRHDNAQHENLAESLSNQSKSFVPTVVPRVGNETVREKLVSHSTEGGEGPALIAV